MKWIYFLNVIAFGSAIFINLNFAVAQSSSTGTAVGTPNQPVTPGSDYLGWAAGVNLSLDIKNYDAMPISFYTDFTGGGIANLRMMIDGTTGNVGIGIAAPAWRLDVAGEINIDNPAVNRAYMINGVTVLQNPGIQNTFVGENAGISSNFLGALDNVFVGFNAGTANNFGEHNVFVGSNSGQSNLNGQFNTFVGSKAGESNTSGSKNTFMGFRSGLFNSSGSWNTFTGIETGLFNTTGGGNCFYGKQAGYNNTTGGGNCFYGSHAGGSNVDGMFNIAIGYQNSYTNNMGDRNIYIGAYGNHTAGLTNSIAIGCSTIVRNDDQMILGDNIIDVGIGLSNDPAGPQNKLEINTGAARPDESGLRFRQLTSASPTVGPSGGRVLSVDANGDVILVDDQVSPPGSGDVTACNTAATGDEGFITKWTSFAGGIREICKTESIFEQFAAGANFGNVGIRTTAPVYNFNNHGNAMFSPEPPPASPYATWNGGQYPLAAKTDADYNLGIGVFSNESTPRERLNIYANDIGHARLESFDRPLIVASTGTWQVEFLGTHPQAGQTLIKNDFSTNIPTFNTPDRGRLYVEANNTQPNNFGAAITAWHLAENPSLPSMINYGVLAKSSAIRGSVSKNIGGGFFGNGSINVNIGVNVEAIEATAKINRGGYFVAREAITLNTGLYAEARPVSSSNVNGESIGGDFIAENSRTNYGVRAKATNYDNSINYGGHFQAIGNTSSTNYGVYAYAAHDPNCGGGTPPTCINAAVYANGDMFATQQYHGSDIKFKTNIQSFQNAKIILNQIEPKIYEFNNAQFPTINLPSNSHHGLIAQDVETILPNLVKTFIQPEETDSVGNVIHPEVSFKAVNYIEFIPILIAGYKEQKAVVDSLKDRIEQIETLLNATIPGSGSKNNTNITEVKLENSISIVLDQNVPNPFADETKISYFLPEDISSAKIIFYETSGRILKEVELKTRGEGVVHVYGQDLSSGIYTYTLLVDGEVFETKKMVKTK